MENLNPLLRLAAISGVESAITFHILRGDNLDARDKDGSTPLILASAKRNGGAVKLLVEAGANLTLVDSKGMNALMHALQVNSPEIVEILHEALNKSQSVLTQFEEVITYKKENISSYSDRVINEQLSMNERHVVSNRVPPSPENLLEITPSKITTGSILNEVSLSKEPFPFDAEFEDGWEVEVIPIAPKGDNYVTENIKNINKTIGQHKAINKDEDWVDIDLYLPIIKSILYNEERDYNLRTFLLSAIQNGIVFEKKLVELCLNPDGSRNYDFERFLCAAVGELGAIVDEQIRETIYDLSLDEASIEEKLLLDEAVGFIKELDSNGNEPFRFYYKNIGSQLLEATEEITLSRDMEEAWLDGLSVLAQWPQGLQVLFECAEKVLRGEADPEVFSSGSVLHLEDESIEKEDVDDEHGEEKEQDASSAFVTAIASVRSKIGNFQDTKEALEAAKLTRGFLFELAQTVKDDIDAKTLTEALERQSYARDRMILCNLRLALSVAKKYQWSGVPIDDLIQEANIGLMKAVERYDWRRGFRFSTYATWWIRQQITRSIADKSRSVRAPVHVQEKARKIIWERDEIELRSGNSERDSDTASRLGIPLSKVWTLLSLFDQEVSLDEIDSKIGCSKVDLLVDPNFVEPSRLVEQSSLHSTLTRILDELDERSRTVIMYRFGLGSNDAMTLEEVGQLFGLTRERIRQIEFKAMSKLSSEKRKEILAPFMIDEDYQ